MNSDTGCSMHTGSGNNQYYLAIQALADSLKSAAFIPGKLKRVGKAIPFCDPLLWLESNPIASRNYWKNRNQSLSLATLGSSLTISSDDIAQQPDFFAKMMSVLGESQACFLGGYAFNGKPGTDQWQEFSAINFCLPLVELRQEHDTCSIHVNIYANSLSDWQENIEIALTTLNGLIFPEANLGLNFDNAIVSRKDSLSFDQWQLLIQKTLFDIRKSNLQKVVFAREVTLDMQKAVDTFALLNQWQQVTPNSFSFLIEHQSSTFIGCSPERLFCRRQNQISTESLAGTVRRGKDSEEDFLLGQELITDVKLRHEHELVTNYIIDNIKPLVSNLQQPDAASVYKLDRIQHRYLPLKAILNPGIGDVDLLLSLHPTPAVGGLPKEESIQHIENNETINRGWYSGVVGIVSNNYSEFAVAIRSALVQEQQIKCYSGVGIVEGSTPSSEWQELESKIESFLSILRVT